METYQKHLADFDGHLTLKNYSKATRSAYGCALRQFPPLQSGKSSLIARSKVFKELLPKIKPARIFFTAMIRAEAHRL